MHDRLCLVAVLDRCGGQDAHVLVGDRAAKRLAPDLRAFDARGRRAHKDSPLAQIGVERRHNRRRQPVAVAIDVFVWARRLQRMLAPGRHPPECFTECEFCPVGGRGKRRVSRRSHWSSDCEGEAARTCSALDRGAGGACAARLRGSSTTGGICVRRPERSLSRPKRACGGGSARLATLGDGPGMGRGLVGRDACART